MISILLITSWATRTEELTAVRQLRHPMKAKMQRDFLPLLPLTSHQHLDQEQAGNIPLLLICSQVRGLDSNTVNLRVRVGYELISIYGMWL